MSPSDALGALRAALSEGSAGKLLPWYADRALFECHTSGRRYRVVGPEAVARVWASAAEGGGEVTAWRVLREEGGADVDVQRAAAGADAGGPGASRSAAGGPGAGSASVPGQAVRQRHTLHLDGEGRIVRHTIHPARPRGSGIVPAVEEIGLAGGEAEEWDSGGWSGARLYRARLAGGEPVVVKHLSPAADWMMRTTGDPGREALLFTDGVYDRLPGTLRATPLAVREVSDGWIVVMRDVSEAHARMGAAGSEGTSLALTALHDLHETFRGREPGSYLCTLEDRLTLFSPARSLIEHGRRETLPSTITPMWETWAEHGDAELVDAVLQLARRPEPLLRALRESGESTLLHGDYQPSNLALDDSGVIALDWSLACYGPPELDVIWLLSNAAWAGDDERDHLLAQWTRTTGVPADSPAFDLAVIFHAVMGELAFLTTERLIQPPGFFVPSPSTVTWWTHRLHTALTRTSLP